MSRRSALGIMVVTAAAVLVLLPASAFAGGPWAVKNALGQRMGTVRTVSATKARVFTQGKDAGLTHRTSRGKWTAYGFLHGYMDAVLIRHSALWGGRPAWQLRGFAESGPSPLIGRLVRHNGRWVVQAGDRTSAWVTRGSVGGRCPAWAAGGAVYLIDRSGF